MGREDLLAPCSPRGAAGRAPRRGAALLGCVLAVGSAAGGAETVLVELGTAMRYLAPASDPALGLTWTAPGFTDSGWTAGSYGVGYDAGGMIVSTVPDPTRLVLTRARFTVADLAAVQTVHLGCDYDDGYVAWVNGVEVARENMPAGTPGFATFASGNRESSNGDVPIYDPISDISAVAKPALLAGENVLAIGVWNVNDTSSDLALVPYLSINRDPGTSTGTPLCGTLGGETRLTVAESPYAVTCDVTVPKGATLRIDPGVEVRVGGGFGITIRGQVFAEGTGAEPIRIGPASGSAWAGIDINHGNDGDVRESVLRHVELTRGSTLLDVADTGTSSILVEDCIFERWTSLAVHWDASHGLVLRRCDFGVNTAIGEANHEAINGYRAGAIVEGCVFGRRRDYNDVIDLGDTSWGEPVPTVQYNTFLGGDDDAVDFDGSAGWIVGNLILDHWPAPGASSSANGGGITGNDASETVVLDNIVLRCYHGIGYKNGCQPLIANNLVKDCHVGVTLYKDSCGAAVPRATLYNNIIWNNHHKDTGVPQNVVLNGRWFPSYCQDATDQGVAELRNCIVEGGWPGDGNLQGDPLWRDPAAGDYTLLPESPAVDAGFGGPLAKTGVSATLLAARFAEDRAGAPRTDLDCRDNTGTGAISYVDIGPHELGPEACGGEPIRRFIRGDSNGDERVDVSDAVHMLLVLFTGTAVWNCDDARDGNDDGSTDLTDAVFVLNFLFRGGAPIPAPYPDKGVDPSPGDPLGCERGL